MLQKSADYPAVDMKTIPVMKGIPKYPQNIRISKEAIQTRVTNRNKLKCNTALKHEIQLLIRHDKNFIVKTITT
jgi:hypothetical protein